MLCFDYNTITQIVSLKFAWCNLILLNYVAQNNPIASSAWERCMTGSLVGVHPLTFEMPDGLCCAVDEIQSARSGRNK